MPDDQDQGGGTADKSAELLQNFKAETDRKLQNLESSMRKSNAELASIMQAALANTRSNSGNQESESDDLDPIDDPKGFVNKLTSKLESVVDKTIDKRLNAHEQKTISRAELYGQFPELQQSSNPLTERVKELYSELSPSQQQDEGTIQNLVYRAASEQGIKPMRNRSNNDGFTLGNSGSSDNRSKRQGKEDEVDDIALAWLELTGAGDPENPDDVKRLATYSKRKSWNKRTTSPTFDRTGKKKGRK